METGHQFNPYFQETHSNSNFRWITEFLAFLLKPPFTQQVQVSIKPSPEKGNSSTVTAVTTVEEEYSFEYGSCWSTAVQITHRYSPVLTQAAPTPNPFSMQHFSHTALDTHGSCKTACLWLLQTTDSSFKRNNSSNCR